MVACSRIAERYFVGSLAPGICTRRVDFIQSLYYTYLHRRGLDVDHTFHNHRRPGTMHMSDLLWIPWRTAIGWDVRAGLPRLTPACRPVRLYIQPSIPPPWATRSVGVLSVTRPFPLKLMAQVGALGMPQCWRYALFPEYTCIVPFLSNIYTDMLYANASMLCYECPLGLYSSVRNVNVPLSAIIDLVNRPITCIQKQ